jgi:hypothetical protein
MSAPATRTLVVRSSTAVYWGTGKHGDFSIFEIEATSPDGEPITVPLRSFTEIPAGAGEFSVSPYTSKTGEKSYTRDSRDASRRIHV